MFGKLRMRRPSAVTAVLFAALVAAVGGLAAVATNKDEVTLRAVSGGPVQTGAPGEDVEISLTNASFTQRAGEAVLLIADADTSANRVSSCTVHVVVHTTDADGALFVEDVADKGEIGDDTEHELLPAPATNTPRTLEAFAEEDPDSCDVDGEDTWTASVNVSVVTLRN